MKIAVTYENGNVFQHFGRTENFKIYDIEDSAIKASEVIGNNGTGHEALADYLADSGVNVLICGGLGDGAKMALDAAGIDVFSGATGDADKAVEAYLAGELVSSGVNCDHHDHHHEEGHSCGHHEDGSECDCGSDCGSSCGGGCGGCGGGCGTPQIIFEGPNAGKAVKAHYRGTFDDGVEFDSSYDRGEPLQFVAGLGMMIPGFDKAIVDMKVGEVKEIHLTPDEAYGDYDPNAVFTVAINELPGAEELAVGQRIYLQTPYGQPLPVLVTDLSDTEITFDANSEMAGKALNFTIELVEVGE